MSVPKGAIGGHAAGDQQQGRGPVPGAGAPSSESVAKSVEVDYFAVFREQRKTDRETLETSAATLIELYRELRERYDFPLPPEAVRVAVNDEFASWDSELDHGDRVAFIPPVAGG